MRTVFFLSLVATIFAADIEYSPRTGDKIINLLEQIDERCLGGAMAEHHIWQHVHSALSTTVNILASPSSPVISVDVEGIATLMAGGLAGRKIASLGGELAMAVAVAALCTSEWSYGNVDDLISAVFRRFDVDRAEYARATGLIVFDRLILGQERDNYDLSTYAKEYILKKKLPVDASIPDDFDPSGQKMFRNTLIVLEAHATWIKGGWKKTDMHSVQRLAEQHFCPGKEIKSLINLDVAGIVLRFHQLKIGERSIHDYILGKAAAASQQPIPIQSERQFLARTRSVSAQNSPRNSPKNSPSQRGFAQEDLPKTASPRPFSSPPSPLNSPREGMRRRDSSPRKPLPNPRKISPRTQTPFPGPPGDTPPLPPKQPVIAPLNILNNPATPPPRPSVASPRLLPTAIDSNQQANNLLSPRQGIPPDTLSPRRKMGSSSGSSDGFGFLLPKGISSPSISSSDDNTKDQ